MKAASIYSIKAHPSFKDFMLEVGPRISATFSTVSAQNYPPLFLSTKSTRWAQSDRIQTRVLTGGEPTVLTRRQALNQFLVEMDGIKKDRQFKDMLIIAATNLEDQLDPAMTRAGRFDKIIRMSSPDLEDRHKLMRYYLGKVGLIAG